MEGMQASRKRKCDWPSGDVYVGDWVADRQEGIGVMTNPRDGKYEGQWKASHKEGRGTLTWPSGERYRKVGLKA
ncbi:hypothetical protein AGMMS49949_02450 [Alphaproteobacteria bacterium]|nr:hypothetical protein AGMMS49949_02450 [Alphaproteobacteria bacterium]GHS98213.1 hypothetical protein AGMMS50296_5760 [Alphaproteobacteria bacterium]